MQIIYFRLKEIMRLLSNIRKPFFACHELDKEFCESYGIQKLDCETEIGHGRIEKREYYLCIELKWFIDKKDWVNLKGIGMVKSWRMNKKTGEASYEARYFITSVDDESKASVALRLAGVLKTIFIGFWMLCLMKIFQPCAKTILLRILTFSESMPLMFSSRSISRNVQKRKILQFPTNNICAINVKIAWK